MSTGRQCISAENGDRLSRVVQSLGKWFGHRHAALAESSAIRGYGANRDRTGDLLLAKQALTQLSYGPRDLRV